MKKALVVGGNSGIGLAFVLKLIEKGFDQVYIVGKEKPSNIPREYSEVFRLHTCFI